MDALTRAKVKAAEFDAESALERKTLEARALAKRQAHVRDDGDDDDELVEGGEGEGQKTNGLVDRTLYATFMKSLLTPKYL